MVFIIRVEQIFFWWEIGGTQKLDRDYDPLESEFKIRNLVTEFNLSVQTSKAEIRIIPYLRLST
jgi:hypothetical protein